MTVYDDVNNELSNYDVNSNIIDSRNTIVEWKDLESKIIILVGNRLLNIIQSKKNVDKIKIETKN